MRKCFPDEYGDGTEVVPAPDPSRGSGPFEGRWLITEMALWADDALHDLGPAQLVFSADGFGSMRFVVVEASLDLELTERDGTPAIAWSWLGDDDGGERSGRGWAVLRPDGTLAGRIYFYRGDASDFAARRASE